MKSLFFLLALFFHALHAEKILICGVCKDVAPFMTHMIHSVVSLGNCFEDYRVIIYENNSTDGTKQLLLKWQQNNPRVIVFLEDLSQQELQALGKTRTMNHHTFRTEVIAFARNRVLEEIEKEAYQDFDYVVMADLDFHCQWPIKAIQKAIKTKQTWHALFANGITAAGVYYDRYAFRNYQFPFGPEFIGELFWESVANQPIYFNRKLPWVLVDSAFGGLGIYKKEAILGCRYTGVVNQAVLDYSEQQLRDPSVQKETYVHYLNQKHPGAIHHPWMEAEWNSGGYNDCVICEHVPFHYQMKLNGFDQLYIVPNMVLAYP